MDRLTRQLAVQAVYDELYPLFQLDEEEWMPTILIRKQAERIVDTVVLIQESEGL